MLAFQAPAAPQSLPGKPTLYLIGDSTVKVGTLGQVGWGERIDDFFDPARISVLNLARGGRSSRTYLTEGLWDRVLTDLKRGDTVIMQFGHNDGSQLFTGNRPRGSIKGTGEETESGTVEMTGKAEVVHSFGWYLRRFITDAKAKGATPIVCSLIPRNEWKDGRIVRDPYAAWARDVAVAEGVAFVDLNEITARRYEEMGPETVQPLFPNDHTHTNAAGADLNAASVIAGLKGLPACRLCEDLSPKADAVSAWPPRSSR
jgi:rhamnogalacturonan acetylesterase